jgi:hypothetical protein
MGRSCGEILHQTRKEREEESRANFGVKMVNEVEIK